MSGAWHLGPTAPVLRPAAEPAPETTPLRRPRREPPPAAPPVRWHWVILFCWAVLLQVVLYSNGGYSWHFFAEGAALLRDQHPPGMTAPGGLHLYANYPQLQIGPLALLVAIALEPFASDGGWMVDAWLMTLCGLAVLYLIEHLVRVSRPPGSRAQVVTLLAGGLSFLFAWELLAVHFGHLDDVLALLLLTCAAVAVRYRAPVLTGVFLGLAVDAKPWALACAALLLVAPWRDWWRGAAAVAIVVALGWLPFVLADPHSLAVTSFVIPNVDASSLRALGVTTPNTPSWDREAQIALGCGLGVLAVLRRRWPAVLALGIGARIVLDPSVYTYYTAGFALGVLIWDLVGFRRPMPVLSALCFAGLIAPVFLLHNGHLLGELRLWTLLVAGAVLLVIPGRKEPI